MKKRNIVFIGAASFFLIMLLSSKVRNAFVDLGYFLTAFLKAPKKIGSIIPSSYFLSKAITKHITHKNGPIKILEVGGGTGAFTKQIIKKMKEGDLLDVMEIDPYLCELLAERFSEYKNVHIHCVSILDWKPQYRYDFIVSGLPFNSFSADFVQAIVDKYKTLIKNKGVLSYFAYLLATSIKKLFLTGEEKLDYRKNIDILSKFRKNFLLGMDIIWMNIPPAYVYHLKVKL